MDGWPPIGEPELVARLAMPDAEFVQFALSWAQAIGPREFTDQIYERALGYPWARPAKSYLLTGEQVQSLEDVPADIRADFFSGGAGSIERYPLLTFGSNGAPGTLALKFGHLSEEERRVLVVAGDLHDFDVGASAMPAVYGSLPATIFSSPGTAVRASVLWVTAAQFVALTWTEISYHLGRLDGIRFQPNNAGAPPTESVFAFASRWGAHCVDGDMVAMQAIPATKRVAPAFTQEQLLDQVARLVLDDKASSRDLVRRLIEDFAETAAALAPMLLETACPFKSEHWVPFPA